MLLSSMLLYRFNPRVLDSLNSLVLYTLFCSLPLAGGGLGWGLKVTTACRLIRALQACLTFYPYPRLPPTRGKE